MQCLKKGVPVIGYDIRGLNDLIINDFNGYLFNFDELKLISNKIIELYNDKSKMQLLINNAILSIDEKYTSTYINEKIYNFINTI